MTHSSFFTGIGGFDLAAQQCGFENIFQVEFNKYCIKVLEKNFPNVKRFGDIKEFFPYEYKNAIDIISGGFPCQPFSHSGKRKGTEDNRYLWPELFRCIKTINPGWVTLENVSGLVSWSNGMVLNQIISDLESEKYTVIPPVIIPACGTGAPHRRDRVWIIAYSNKSASISGGGISKREIESTPIGFNLQREFSGFGEVGIVADPSSIRGKKVNRVGKTKQFNKNSQVNYWQNWPTQSPVCGRNDGIPNRVDRIEALGNAIVPQVAYNIFKVIKHLNHAIHTN